MSLVNALQSIQSHPDTKSAPLAVWSRWAYWQTRQVFTAKPRQAKFLGGTKLNIYPHEGLTGCWYFTHPEWEEMRFLEAFLRPGDRFYDVGSNAGAFSVLAMGYGCSVVAFEPVPSTFERLVENVSLNPSRGLCACLNVGAGVEPSRLTMTSNAGTGNRVVGTDTIPNADDLIEVEITTLDIAAESHFYPNFIKIDVEGHELEVLKGATKVLANESLQGLLVETFRPSNWQLPTLRSIEDLLKSFDFIPYQFNAATKRIERLEKLDQGGNNTFYFRCEDSINARLQ